MPNYLLQLAKRLDEVISDAIDDNVGEAASGASLVSVAGEAKGVLEVLGGEIYVAEGALKTLAEEEVPDEVRNPV